MRVLVIAVAIVSLPTIAAAQKNLGRERISLQFDDVPVVEACGRVASAMGYEISISAPRALVTLRLENVTAKAALTAICEKTGCQWRRSGKRLVIDARRDVVTLTRMHGAEFHRTDATIRNHRVQDLDDRLPFDIVWAPVDLNLAFKTLSRMTNAGVAIAPALGRRKVAVSITDASLHRALDAVCAIGSCRWELREEPQRLVRVVEWRRGERIYDEADEGLTLPTVIASVKPWYSEGAMRALIQGVVGISGIVESDGSVTDVEVLQSLDHDLDQQAIDAAYRWRFRPGTMDGRPVPVRVTIDMSFTLR